MGLSEFQIIQAIQKNLKTNSQKVVKGIGDDCAVLQKNADEYLVISTDSLIQNVHFDLNTFSFYDIGHKSMAVNLSDIAAMAATPECAFVSLGLPNFINEKQIQDFYDGLESVSKPFDVTIVGGDLSKSPNDFFINLTVTGVVQKQKCKLRSFAKADDVICVSGQTGFSALGLEVLQQKQDGYQEFVQAQKNPMPQIQLAKILSEFSGVHALIDVSDGLVQDLNHILVASNLAAEIDLENLPCDESFIKACLAFNLNPYDLMLSGGEDYQLLFTVNPSELDDLMQKCVSQNLTITPIGKVKPWQAETNRVQIFNKDHKIYQLQKLGYDHFK